jgi:hypothetical protein
MNQEWGDRQIETPESIVYKFSEPALREKLKEDYRKSYKHFHGEVFERRYIIIKALNEKGSPMTSAQITEELKLVGVRLAKKETLDAYYDTKDLLKSKTIFSSEVAATRSDLRWLVKQSYVKKVTSRLFASAIEIDCRPEILYFINLVQFSKKLLDEIQNSISRHERFGDDVSEYVAFKIEHMRDTLKTIRRKGTHSDWINLIDDSIRDCGALADAWGYYPEEKGLRPRLNQIIVNIHDCFVKVNYFLSMFRGEAYADTLESDKGN